MFLYMACLDYIFSISVDPGYMHALDHAHMHVYYAQANAFNMQSI